LAPTRQPRRRSSTPLEAGVATLLRLQPRQADLIIVVAQPIAKAIEVARRAAR